MLGRNHKTECQRDKCKYNQVASNQCIIYHMKHIQIETKILVRNYSSRRVLTDIILQPIFLKSIKFMRLVELIDNLGTKGQAKVAILIPHNSCLLSIINWQTRTCNEIFLDVKPNA